MSVSLCRVKPMVSRKCTANKVSVAKRGHHVGVEAMEVLNVRKELVI